MTVRQTNVIWIGFVYATSLLRLAREQEHKAGREDDNEVSDPLLRDAGSAREPWCAAYLGMTDHRSADREHCRHCLSAITRTSQGTWDDCALHHTFWRVRRLP